MMASDVAAKKLVAAVRREILRVERAMGETDVDQEAHTRATAGAAITSLVGAMGADCLKHGVNPLHALLDGLLCSLAVEMQEAGRNQGEAVNSLAARFVDMWNTSAAIDADRRTRAH
jgi:hypothetical protein